MKHPLTTVALFYTAGVMLGNVWELPTWSILSLSLGLSVAAMADAKRRAFWLCVLLVLFGCASLTVRTAILSPLDLRVVFGDATEIVTIEGRLQATPEQRLFIRDEKASWRTQATLEVHSVKRGETVTPADGLVAVTTPGILSVRFFGGRNVSITGTLQTPSGPAAERLFDYRAYLAGQGVHHLLKVEQPGDWRPVDENEKIDRPWTDRFRDWAQATLKRGLPVEDEPLRLIWAMVLGWKPALTDEVSEPFMRSGTLHIFAISGLHIALIAGILISVFRVFRIPREACGLLVIPLIWFYTAATGWQASAIRSTVMMTVILGGWMLRRPTNLLNSLAAAGLIILVWDPRQLFQAGFQLSFFVVLGLALITPPIEKLRRRLLEPDPLLPLELRPRWERWLRYALGYLTSSLATSLAAWLGSVPLIAYYFFMITPVSLLANLLIVPLSSVGLASSLGSLACGDWLPWLTELFNHSSWLWMKCMIELSTWSASLPSAFFFVRPPHWHEFVIYYGALAALLSGWAWRGGRWKWVVSALGIWCAWVASQAWLDRKHVEITVLPLGGSGILVDAPGDASDLLLNCGDRSGAQFMLRPFLRSRGINHLPRLTLSHGELRHVEAFNDLLGDFSIGEVVTSPLRFRSPAYREVIKKVDARPGWHKQMSARERIGLWEIIHPASGDQFPRADDAALVLRGEFGSIRVLILPELARSGQQKLIERVADLEADIVIAGVPNDGEPLIDGLLSRIQPRVIVLATSEFPVAARLNSRLRERLNQSEISLFSAEQQGAVTIDIKEGIWSIRTMRGGRAEGHARTSLAPINTRSDERDAR